MMRLPSYMLAAAHLRCVPQHERLGREAALKWRRESNLWSAIRVLELYTSEPNTFFLKPLIALAEKQAQFATQYFDATHFEQFVCGRIGLDVQ
jgi:hypothetical protein